MLRRLARVPRIFLAVPIAVLAVPLAFLAAPGATSAVVPARAAAPQAVTIDGGSAGRTFDGVGALSAGASSRLLVDYPEPQRGQVLDYLFKPGYGAALQILKVEVGGDTNSTDGAEPSHMRSTTDLDCDRGYEWWLMEQAKARNPDIELSALAWGAPGWTGEDGKVWSAQYIDYLLAWLGCAKKKGMDVDYIGGWNEMGFDAAWYKQLHRALRDAGYQTKIVIDDSFDWTVVDTLTKDPELAAAIDVVGQHYVCGYLTDYTSCPSPEPARALGKPLHASEQGSLPFDSGAAPLARAMNRQYVDGAITSTINWSLVASWFNTQPFPGAGLMGANEPWSGAYEVGPTIWSVAHTTQFTRPGWRYLDSAKGRLAGGGSHVALRSPASGDYSVVAETLDATRPQEVSFEVKGGLDAGALRVWSSDLSSADPGRWFVRGDDITPEDGRFTLTLRPGHVYSLTTTGGQGRGAARPPASKDWPLPYRDGFDSYKAGRTPRHLSDLEGAYEAQPCQDRPGGCLQQMVTEKPVGWFYPYPQPATLAGDPISWQDYRVSTDARIEEGWAELVGRIDAAPLGTAISGIHLRVSADGQWVITSDEQGAAACLPSDPNCANRRAAPAPRRRVLAQGKAATKAAAGRWHRLGLRFSGQRVAAYLDGRRIAELDDGVHRTGSVGLVSSPWRRAQFDDLKVEPLPRRDPPGGLRWLSPRRMTASGTAYHLNNTPRNVLDGSVGSLWHTPWSPPAPLPQSVTLDLGRTRQVGMFGYQPRRDNVTNGNITRYELAVSTDGETYTPVSAGTWQPGAARKTVAFPARPARYVRLTALEGVAGHGSAAELGVAGR